MTLHVDEELLDRVIAATGCASKTAAIDFALREIDRKTKLAKLASEGLGMGPDELREEIDPAYDLVEMRRREMPATYGRKPRSR